MENEKTILDYIGQVFTIFGISMIILHMLSLFLGESARDLSTLFFMGKGVLTTDTAMQFLLMSVLVVLYRFVLFTDRIIKNMSVALRTVLMYVAIVCTVVVLNTFFAWFPADMWEAWVGFGVSFGICSTVSTLVVLLRDKMENQKLQEALDRMK